MSFLPGFEPGSEAMQADRKLETRFGVPPFTVLDARQGYWRWRKGAWLQLGIQSEVGRGELGATPVNWTARGQKRRATKKDIDEKGIAAVSGGLTYSGGGAGVADYRVKEGKKESTTITGTSVFDPVLCELFYRWFVPPGGSVLDPFAGGSVRGIVASRLGRHYTGIELRPEQVAANVAQAAAICRPADPPPRWLQGDARDVLKLAGPEHFDACFSCPPYGDLEVYSDDARDLSMLDWQRFKDAYSDIIETCCLLLRRDRFAAFAVGDYRDKKTGMYRAFPELTCAAFVGAGLHKYNEFILVTPIGSLPVRAGGQFAAGRKAGKSHQNLFVFVHGDSKEAAEACGPVVTSLEWMQVPADDETTSE